MGTNKKVRKNAVRRILSFFLLILLSTAIFGAAGCAKKEEEKKSVTTTSPLPDSRKQSSEYDESFAYDVYADYVEITAYLGSGAVVAIPESYGGTVIMSIGKEAFYGNTVVTSVIMPDTVVNIANKAFAKCTNLREVIMPGVRSIGMESFKDSGLEQVTLPLTLQNLGKYSFSGSALTSVDLPASIVKASDYVFADCPNLTSFTLPDTMTVIPKRMFRNCSSLTTVIIPDTVTELDDYSFSACRSLTEIYIPASVTKIGEAVFYNSPQVTIITPEGSAAAKYAEANGLSWRSQ